MLLDNQPSTVNNSVLDVIVSVAFNLLPEQVRLIVNSHPGITECIRPKRSPVRLGKLEALVILRSPRIPRNDVSSRRRVNSTLGSLVFVNVIHPLVIMLMPADVHVDAVLVKYFLHAVADGLG